MTDDESLVSDDRIARAATAWAGTDGPEASPNRRDPRRIYAEQVLEDELGWPDRSFGAWA